MKFTEDIDHPEAKDTIRNTVALYKKVFSTEYDNLVKTLKDKRGELEISDNDWAELKEMDAVERHIWDIPHTLYNKLMQELSDDELDWLFARGEFEGDFSGVRWFVTEFPEFRATKAF